MGGFFYPSPYYKESKEMNTNQERNANLPIRRNLTLTYALSFIVAILIVTASVAGILYRTVIYPTDELLRLFVSNDVVNLFIGLPILLGSKWMAWRENERCTSNSGGLKGSTRGWEATSRGLVGRVSGEALG